MKRIYAHRGVPSLAPENTMSAFEQILSIDTKWLETDISITSDEELFILHDDYLDRTTDISGAITETSSEEVRNADAGSWYGKQFIGEHVPTVEQTIDFINENHLNINIELKAVVGKNANHLADVLVEKLNKQINRLNSDVEILISSLNPIMLLKLQELKPDLKYACLFKKETLDDDWNLYMQACHAQAINVESKTLTKEKVQEFKDLGYEVNVWTVDSKLRANQLFNWGVDGIFTNKAQDF